MKYLSILLPIIVLLALSSCKEDEPKTPIIPNEEEVITTLTYTLIDINSLEVYTFLFQDLDGDGGNPPIIIADTLEAYGAYAGSISILNELETPAGDITAEVEAEGTEHQMFYLSSNDNLTVSYTDMDTDGNPLGIGTQLTCGDPGSGTLTIVLRHEPNKFGEGVSGGDITNAGGETDIEIIFNVVVE